MATMKLSGQTKKMPVRGISGQSHTPPPPLRQLPPTIFPHSERRFRLDTGSSVWVRIRVKGQNCRGQMSRGGIVLDSLKAQVAFPKNRTIFQNNLIFTMKKNASGKHCGKGEIAQNEQFHLPPQCFLCNLYLKIL